jgi:hypothetical protein
MAEAKKTKRRKKTALILISLALLGASSRIPYWSRHFDELELGEHRVSLRMQG